jgi:hypothetical protein
MIDAKAGLQGSDVPEPVRRTPSAWVGKHLLPIRFRMMLATWTVPCGRMAWMSKDGGG